MAERLANLAKTTDLGANEYANIERLRFLESRPPPTDPNTRRQHNKMLAVETLLAGHPKRAVALLESMRAELGPKPDPAEVAFVHQYLTLAYLRQGEQDNCVERHGPDSCLFPIEGGGVHKDQTGSRSAMKELAWRLEAQPGDLTARWLYNIAAMTVGEFPGGVPKAWRIPDVAVKSERRFPRYPDIAAAVGLDTIGLAGGAVVEDFDGDGRLDVMASSMGHLDQIRLFINDGDGRFVERTKEAWLDGLVGGLNLTHADFDNDGDADVWVMRGAWLHNAGHVPASLLRNDGGRFTDVTKAAGLDSAHPSQTAVWGDFDNDGWLDLFVGNETGHGHRHACELFRNNRDGTFTEISRVAGTQVVGYVKGVTAGDYDNDGWLDIYVSRLDGKNVLLRNLGAKSKWRFEDTTKKAGVAEPERSFPVWFFDHDNDGWLDLWVSGYRANVGDVLASYMGLPNRGVPPKLYRNNRDGTFTDIAKAANIDTPLLTMGCNFGDLDNDGWLDFYAGTGEPNLQTLVPNRVFKNEGGARFVDITVAGGFGHLQKGHGVAFADLAHDGAQDIFTVIGGAYSGDVFQNALYRNPGHGHHWIKLIFKGVKSNPIGARYAITVDGGKRTLHRVVTTGGSFGSSPLRQEVGLGKATKVDRLEVTWPASGVRQSFEGLLADKTYRITEGSDAPELVELPASPLLSPKE